jgi:hypothetical protein
VPRDPRVHDDPPGAEPSRASTGERVRDERVRAAGRSIPTHRQHVPSPHDIAELSGAFAMTANVHDPDPTETEPAVANRPVSPAPQHFDHDHDDTVTERGLRGLVGGGASQVSVVAALRARDAARPTDADLLAAEQDLVIVKRGWVPREELPRPARRP